MLEIRKREVKKKKKKKKKTQKQITLEQRFVVGKEKFAKKLAIVLA